MKLKFPQVLCYQKWIDLYRLPDQKPSLKKRNVKDGFIEETPKMKEIRQRILQTLEKNRQQIEEIEQLMVDYEREYTLEQPPVYLTMVKDQRGSDSTYLYVKTFWPEMGGKRKEIRKYIGTKENFPNHKDPRTIDHSIQVMKQTLKKLV